jgi:hypothetical protein
MKKLLLAMLAVLLVLPAAWAASVVLAWDASPSPDVNRYRVYWGGNSRNYTNWVEVSNQTTATVSNLVPTGTYYFAATALNIQGLESDFSNEVSYMVPRGKLNAVYYQHISK